MAKIRYYLYQNRRWLTPLGMLLGAGLTVYCLIYLYAELFASPTLTLFFGAAAFVLLMLLFAFALRQRHTAALKGAAPFSALFALSVAFGAVLSLRGAVPWGDMRFWLSAVVLMLPAVSIFSMLYRFFNWLEPRGKPPGTKGLVVRLFYNKNAFWLLFGLLLLCWTPMFLAGFPGFFGAGAAEQIRQFAAGTFTQDYPVFLTLLMGGVVTLFSQIFGQAGGFATYSVLQAAAVAAVYSYTVVWLKRRGARLFTLLFATLYFGLSPIISGFVLSGAPAALLSAMALLFLLFTVDFYEDAEGYFKRPALLLRYVAVAVSLLLLGSGVVVFLLFAVIFILLRKARRPQTAALFLGCLLIFAVCIGLSALLGTAPSAGPTPQVDLAGSADGWYLWGTLADGGIARYFDARPAEGAVAQNSLLPGLLERYAEMFETASFLRFPVVRMLFSPAFMGWAAFFALCYSSYRKRKLPVATLAFLSLFAAAQLLRQPVTAENYLPLFFALPLSASFLVDGRLYAEQ